MGKITIIDIAREAGVSFKTVSRVLNNESGVGADTRARVEAVIKARSFKPNSAARSLPGSRSYLIGLLFEAMVTDYYLSELQVGAVRACRRTGYHLIVDETKDLVARGHKALVRYLASLRLDAVILPFPACNDVKVLSALEELDIPYVRISPDKDLERSVYIAMDDRQAAYDMTRYLWKLGHRDIVFLGHRDHAASEWRYEGYCTLMREQGLKPANARALHDMNDVVRVAESMLARPNRPTAIFAATDFSAFGVMATAAKRGLSIPRDLSVAGFDDSPGSESVWPPLTTIHQPIAAMAATAVDILTQGLGGKLAVMSKEARFLDYSLIERASTAPPR